jgi:hypothetical protein
MDKDRMDALFKLADAAWHSFERRSSYEWQVSFALWSGLGLFAGFMLKGGAHIVHPRLTKLIVVTACVSIWFVYALVWSKGLYERNQKDKELADTYWGMIEGELNISPRPNYPAESHWNWSHGTQIAITSLLMLLDIFAVFVSF